MAGADKLHNARTLLMDLRAVGDEVWDRFNVGRDQSLWYYRTVVEVMRANTTHRPALVDELDRTVREFERLS